MQKLPGYNQAQELVKLYRKVGFKNEEIAEQLITIEKLIFAELVVETEEGMNEEDKKKFDQFLLEKSPSPEEIAEFLKLDKQTLAQKIESKIQQLVDQLTEDLTKAELSLEELKASLSKIELPKEQSKPAEKPQKSFFQKILSPFYID